MWKLQKDQNLLFPSSCFTFCSNVNQIVCCVGAVRGKLTSADTLMDLIKTAAWRQGVVEKKAGVSQPPSLYFFLFSSSPG